MDPATGLDQVRKTRSLGLVMAVALAAMIPGFMVIDASFSFLGGIAAWRIVGLVPPLVFLAWALPIFPRLPRLAVALHAAQLSGLMVMMCGICAELVTRQDLPDFARAALISSLLVCIFADFAFAGALRRWLPLILLAPLGAMSVYILAAGAAVPAAEKAWLISNSTSIAIAVSVLAWFQDRSSRSEQRAREELGRATEALETSEGKRHADREALLQRLEFVLAATRTGLDLVDEDYAVQYIDPARRRILGDPEGRRCYQYFRGRADPCGDCAMQRALQTRTVQVMEQASPGEGHRPTQVTAIPYRADLGKWVVAEVVVDISERTRAEAERLEWERRTATSRRLESLGILAGGVAHHFNNLLTVILGHAELLRESSRGDASADSSVREIMEAGARSRELVRQLVALGGRQVLERRLLDVTTVVREQAPLVRAAIRPEIAIEYQLADHAGPVLGDGGRIGEVLLHLALNAQDAIPASGTLLVETSEVTLEEGPSAGRHDLAPGRYVLLTVADTGAGMDAETAARVFDPFFTTKQHGRSTGLGLSSTYGIVKQHNGTIEVESAPGQGSRFLIYLPVSPSR